VPQLHLYFLSLIKVFCLLLQLFQLLNSLPFVASSM
jgi:hypothetical protein